MLKVRFKIQEISGVVDKFKKETLSFKNEVSV